MTNAERSCQNLAEGNGCESGAVAGDYRNTSTSGRVQGDSLKICGTLQLRNQMLINTDGQQIRGYG